MKSQNRILFIHTAGIGDLIQSTKIINTLEDSSNEITFLIKNSHQDFFRLYSGHAKFFLIDFKKYKINLLYRLRTLNQLRGLGFEKVFVLNQHRRIMDDDLALNIGAETIVALNKVEEEFVKFGSTYIDSKYSKILYNTNEYLQNKYEMLLIKYFNIFNFKDSSIYLNEDEVLKTINSKIPNFKKQKFISINPVSSTELKNWKKENFIELIEYVLNKYSYKIILLGEESQYNSLQKMNFNKERIINVAGKTNLLESFLLVKKSLLFLGVDSALAHASVYFNVPRILITGGGSYGLDFPISSYKNIELNQNMVFKEMDCFGCNWHCKFKEPFCINDVSSEKVNEIIDIMLSNQVL